MVRSDQKVSVSVVQKASAVSAVVGAPEPEIKNWIVNLERVRRLAIAMVLYQFRPPRTAGGASSRVL